MRCQRCGADTSVRRHDVDGFTGHVCEQCREAWTRIQERSA